jgi:hypothetical protein
MVHLMTPCKVYKVQSVTRENAVDLHSVDKSPLTLTTAVESQHTDPVKNISLYHRLAFFPLVA